MFGGTVAQTLIQWNVMGEGPFRLVRLVVGLASDPCGLAHGPIGSQSASGAKLLVDRSLGYRARVSSWSWLPSSSTAATASSLPSRLRRPETSRRTYMTALEYCFGSAATWWCWIGAMMRVGKGFDDSVAHPCSASAHDDAALARDSVRLASDWGGRPCGCLDLGGGPWLSIVVVVFLFLANTGTVARHRLRGRGYLQVDSGHAKLKWPLVSALMLLGIAPFVAAGGWWINHLATFFFIAALFPVQYMAIEIVDYYLHAAPAHFDLSRSTR